MDPTVACVAGAFQRSRKILRFNVPKLFFPLNGYPAIRLFFLGESENKSLPNKKGRRTALSQVILNGQNVTHKLSAEIFTSTSTASREILAQRPTLTPGWAKNTLINCMWYRSRFEQSWFSSQLSSLFPGGGVLLGILGGGVPPGSPNPDPISDQKM